MRAVAALALLLLFAGCGPSVRDEEGRIVYKAQQKSAASRLTLTTSEPKVRVDETDPRRELEAHPNEVETNLAPAEMGDVVQALERDGFFDLPGNTAVPADPAPRSIAVDLKSRKFYVAFQDLRDQSEIDRYARATRILIEATQGGFQVPAVKK